MRTMVMTGGSSGFGRLALSQLARNGSRILVGARGTGPEGATTLPLDLSHLASVRAFADRVGNEIGGAPIDALILNAGLHGTDLEARSPDGFEMTFATNHLGHYLLLRLLLPRLAGEAAVVITTSGTHDPAEKTAFPVPRHADAALLAHPERDPGFDRSSPLKASRALYAASKLANVLTARRLARLAAEEGRGWKVFAFCPGEVPGTRLTRDYPMVPRLAWRFAGALAGTGPSVARLMGVTRPQEAAAALVGLVDGDIRPPEGQVYAAVRKGAITWPPLSELARRDDVADALWRDSEALVGLSAAASR
ncbi:hypothetical protein VE25_12325 [Devosia geojensis]|uniref:Dehydrogenase n=1 Tax=Devosia geojensis TaxID=443610 RepID=A0A0F5FRJ5_9HYPH|nr:SDR family NAD(P)-dependent oxidoreductase [Devosia geojensis]KKB11486.1 hypothetical protein VE25_12325 [Devosia geojensis]